MQEISSLSLEEIKELFLYETSKDNNSVSMILTIDILVDKENIDSILEYFDKYGVSYYLVNPEDDSIFVKIKENKNKVNFNNSKLKISIVDTQSEKRIKESLLDIYQNKRGTVVILPLQKMESILKSISEIEENYMCKFNYSCEMGYTIVKSNSKINCIFGKSCIFEVTEA